MLKMQNQKKVVIPKIESYYCIESYHCNECNDIFNKNAGIFVKLNNKYFAPDDSPIIDFKHIFVCYKCVQIINKNGVHNWIPKDN